MQIQKMKENQELYVLVYLATLSLTMTCFGKMTKPSPLHNWWFLWRCINELFQLKHYTMCNLEISSDILLKCVEMEKSIKTGVCVMCKVQKQQQICVDYSQHTDLGIYNMNI